MKKLILIFFFSGSLDGFSQEVPAELPRNEYTLEVKEYPRNLEHANLKSGLSTPDTLRAICLVTLFPNGIAHARMGFVVICEGKRPVYLDCNKKALKLPQVGWRYELIDPNYKR